MINLGITVDVPNNNIKTIMTLINSKKINSLQMMFTKKNITDKEIKKILKITKKIKYKFIHASYQINIGSESIITENNIYNHSIQLLIDEMNISNKLNVNGIVVHLGKNTQNRYDDLIVYNNMITNITNLFGQICFYKSLKNSTNSERLSKQQNIVNINNMPTLLIETSSGQKGELCYNLNDFVEFILSFKNTYFYENIGICIDTCHVFQAGYDINNEKIIKKIHKIFEPIKNKIKLIHLNSSFNTVGQHIDRHESIGKGHILTKSLAKFILPYLDLNIPIIMETSSPYNEQINTIKNEILVNY